MGNKMLQNVHRKVYKKLALSAPAHGITLQPGDPDDLEKSPRSPKRKPKDPEMTLEETIENIPWHIRPVWRKLDEKMRKKGKSILEKLGKNYHQNIKKVKETSR